LASLWLNAGVPATEVARRAGHGVAVLLKVYANCIDGQAGAANQRINAALDKRSWHPAELPYVHTEIEVGIEDAAGPRCGHCYCS
jgi:hypothetical protein